MTGPLETRSPRRRCRRRRHRRARVRVVRARAEGCPSSCSSATASARGASGVAAGMLAPVTEADFGEDELLELNLAAAERWPAFADELRAASGRGCRGFRETARSSSRPTATTPRSLHRLADLHAALGLPVAVARAARVPRARARAVAARSRGDPRAARPPGGPARDRARARCRAAGRRASSCASTSRSPSSCETAAA